MNKKKLRPVAKRTKVPDLPARYFDLNMEKVLDAWQVSNAIREIIANALDESILTSTPLPEIVQRGVDRWVIRDFGRGLRYKHLTQSENAEKKKHERDIIGRFGFGLKDALAVLNRCAVGVHIRSSHGDINLVQRAKMDFPDVVTLHGRFAESSDPTMRGTEVELQPINASDVQH